MLELETRQVETAALLYDVGKFILRTQGKLENDFAKVGADFLSKYFSDDAGKKILSYIAANDSLLVEAAALASGTDSRTVDRQVSKKLENVFNIFGNAGKNSVFDLRPLKNDEMNLPVADNNENLSEKYAELLAEFENYLSNIPKNKFSPNDIAQILEKFWSYVPAGTAENELSDISLYDHAKLTAAYSVCLYKYLKENNDVTNFENLRDKEIFLLVSGDISGIQQFIYTIPSKGALKSLRGRSFYLEILLEDIADEILTAAGVSRNCLLYTGGGHFYLLLPNTSEIQKILKNFSDTINDWLLKHFGSRLYLAVAWTPSTALEFIGKTETGTGAPFRRVSELLSKNKLQRYNETQLREMFNPESSINKTLDGSRECGICHNSARELFYYNDEDETLACESCRNLYLMGKKMLDGEGFIVIKKISETDYLDALPLPNDCYLYPLIDVEKISVAQVVRTYIKKRGDIKIGTVGIWLADYVTRNSSGVLCFEELANLSGGSEDSDGIKRLGVMRADVDNLGAAFMAGFPAKYSTLTRTATLSRQLAHFFKHIMIFICEGKIAEKFQLFKVGKKNLRDIHVVYSGGDDVFLVGAWDDLIELAVDIQRIFEQFTNGKLTFSAGIGFFQPKFPVAELARKTGILEDAAKDNPSKNSVALFGAPTAIKSDSQEPEKAQCYSWKIFVEKVCGEKLKFLLDNFNFDTTIQIENRLTLGKSGLYRILNFLADINLKRQSVNLARFAYLLARLNPSENKTGYAAYKKIRDKFYFWYKDLQDRQELRTAIELVIYGMREKGAN